MDEKKKDDILRHFSTFKDYLAKHVEPRNREEKLLNELWHVANDEERQHLASILLKLTDQTN